MPRPTRAVAAATATAKKAADHITGKSQGSRKRSAAIVDSSVEDKEDKKAVPVSPSAKRVRTGAVPQSTQSNKVEAKAEESSTRKGQSALKGKSKGTGGDVPPRSTNDSAKVKAEPSKQAPTTVKKPEDEEDSARSSADEENIAEQNGKSGKCKVGEKQSASKTKVKKASEAMPLAPRSTHLKIFAGAHVSSAGGVQNSISNAVHIGGNAFALFLKSQRKWDNPALKPEQRDEFKSQCSHHAYAANSHVLPHGSYLVNLAQADPDKAKQAYTTFLDDLERCEALGIRLYNFHPGNTNGLPRAEALGRIAQRLNDAHKATSSVITVLENMAAAANGNTIGGSFEDLRAIIDLVKDKSRVGVCIDTCHAFAAGYDLRSPSAFKNTMDTFDKVVGVKYLKALHINDSKAPFGSHRDLHQNIGLGFLGLRAFHNVVNEKRFENLPLILETPIDRKSEDGGKDGKAKAKVVEDKRIWADEIKLLERMVGMDAESDEFRNMEADLAKKGEAERKKFQDQFDKKTEKDQKSKTKDKKGKKKDETSDDDDEDED